MSKEDDKNIIKEMSAKAQKHLQQSIVTMTINNVSKEEER